MTDAQNASTPPDSPDDGLDDLPYADLHDRAFALAQKRRDVSFFVDLYRHTAALNATADEGGSLGEFTGSIIEAMNAAKEAFGRHAAAETEQMFRARFVEYLRANAQ